MFLLIFNLFEGKCTKLKNTFLKLLHNLTYPSQTHHFHKIMLLLSESSTQNGDKQHCSKTMENVLYRQYASGNYPHLERKNNLH